MNLDKFNERCTDLSQNALAVLPGFEASIEQIFGEGVPQYNDHDAILSVFDRKKTIGQAFFYSVKKLLKIYYECLAEEGLVTQETLDFIDGLKLQDLNDEELIRSSYFVDLDECINFITMVGRGCGLRNQDCLLNIKTIAILSWFGISNQDMINILQDQVHVGHIELIHDGKEEYVYIPKQYCKILTEYAECTVETPLYGKPARLKPSAYLLRTKKTEYMTETALRSVIKRFNKTAMQYGKLLSFISLRHNGLFVKLTGDSDEDIVKQIREELQCDRSFAFGIKNLYRKWLRYVSQLREEAT